MTESKNGNDVEAKSPRESGEDSEDENEILEESPCGRWSKRRKEVQQRDVPGIDAAYLAIDTDEAMEVVWNEVQVRFSERRDFHSKEEKIKHVFDNLIQLDHSNIVKLHKYWIDTNNEKRRVVFITESMSSGSLKKLLKLSKKNNKKISLNSWKRWCTQILSALSYLHSCSPPIIHGNLTTDTISIQHTGLVKIGSVAPDAIQTHVKTYRGDIKNVHYIAPEFGNPSHMTTAVDIYSFGMCALEMAALEIPGNGETGNTITQEQIQKTISSLEHEIMKDFIRQCLNPDPLLRPSATELLFHPILFEVHSLKLLAAHCLIKKGESNKSLANGLEDALQQQFDPFNIFAEITQNDELQQFKLGDITKLEKLDKFMEDVRYGIYPLTAFKIIKSMPKMRPISPETFEATTPQSPEKVEEELRRVVNMMCIVKPNEEGSGLQMTINLRLDNKMNRQLSCIVEDEESGLALTDELIGYGFINRMDRDKIANFIDQHLLNVRSGQPTLEVNGELSSYSAPVTSR